MREARVTISYTATKMTELTVEQDSTVLVVEEKRPRQGWVLCQQGNRIGLVPLKNIVFYESLLSSSPVPSSPSSLSTSPSSLSLSPLLLSSSPTQTQALLQSAPPPPLPKRKELPVPAKPVPVAKNIKSPRSEIPKTMLKRRELVKELARTEESYVQVMNIFWEVNAQKAKNLSKLSEKDWLCMFGNVEQILGANKVLLEGLREEINRVGKGNEENCCIGKVFLDIVPYFKLYTDFINNYNVALDTVERLSKRNYFRKYLQECEEDPKVAEATQSCRFQSLLICPIQRIPRYQLLLQTIIDVTSADHPDFKNLASALERVCEMAQYCDESKSVSDGKNIYFQLANTLAKELKYESFIQSYRKYICSCKIISHFDDQIRSRSPSTGSGMVKNLKQSVKYVKDSILSPRVGAKLTYGEEFYNVHLFNDSLVIERDVQSSDTKKYIELLFLHYMTMIPLSDNSAIVLEAYVENKKRVLEFKPIDSGDSNYMTKYELLKNELQDSIKNIVSKYQQRLNISTPLNEYAEKRLKIEEKRKNTQMKLNQTLIMTLDSRKKLAMLEEEILSKEEQLRKLQEELEQLREDKETFIMMNETNAASMEDLNHSLQAQLSELEKVDSVLIASLSDETAAFAKVFADDPCLVRAPIDNKINDVYNGRKLRRRQSLTRVISQNSDYSAFEQSSFKETIFNTYKNKKILFSSMIYCINRKAISKVRRMVITDSAIYMINLFMGAALKWRMPLTSLTCISVSTSDDNFLCLHSATFNDYLFYSTVKTEIIQILVERCKALGKEIYVQVTLPIIFSPEQDKVKRLRIEPRILDSDFEIRQQDSIGDSWRVYYDPDSDDASFRMNKNFLKENVSVDVSLYTYYDTISETVQDIYNGKKKRRIASINRYLYGDYISFLKHSESVIKKLPSTDSPPSIKFFDYIEKLNKIFKVQVRLLLITEKNLYYIEPKVKAIKGSVPLSDIKGITVSALGDNYFCLHVSFGNDLLMISDKKTEIIQVLRKYCPKPISLDVNNIMSFRRKKMTWTGTFTESKNVIETSMTVTGPTTFSVLCGRKLRAPIIFESLDVQVDGLGEPVLLYPDSYITPTIRLPTSLTYFSCTLAFYTLEKINGYHIDVYLSSLSHLSNNPLVSTSMGEIDKSDQRQTINIKRQKIAVSLGRLDSTTVSLIVLDQFGIEVEKFKFHVNV